MTRSLISAAAARAALGLRDLTDPGSGPHAMQRLLADVVEGLRASWACEVQTRRECPVVSVADNYDDLGYPPDGAARDARYTRYLGPDTLLRTQTSAMVPRLLAKLAGEVGAERLLVCPGLVYRRDAIDRLHTGEPHQVDLWRVRASGPALARSNLLDMIAAVCDAALPGWEWRTIPASHPYTRDGLQIDVRAASGEWVEIGECGLADPDLLRRCGLPAEVTGLAMGLGLDRLLMLRKGIDDIRLLRSDDPRVAAQLLDLEPYQAVSSQPATRRDLSVAVAPNLEAEDLGDRVRAALGPDADCVEDVTLISKTPYAQLPPQAVQRIGISPDQANALVRIVIRHPTRSLTSAAANALRDRVYAAIHEGTAWQWASRESGAGRAASTRDRGRRKGWTR